MERPRRRRWALGALAALAVLAAAGVGLSTWLFSRWTHIRVATTEESGLLLEAAIAGAGPPYLEISPGGSVSVRRDLEAPAPSPLSALHVLAADPGPDPGHVRLYRLDLPWWFVRAKMTDSLNLGTLVTALASDWDHLDLKVTEEDLERRGPGLILDHRPRPGRRLVAWTD